MGGNSSSKYQVPDPPVSTVSDEGVRGNIVHTTRFHTDGNVYIVTRSCILDYPCDVVGNSVGTKSSDTENVLARGDLAQKIGKRGGQHLINELASSKHACWSYGEIRFTDSHGLDRGVSSPKKIVHFCVPVSYTGDTTYLQIMSLFERSLAITHDMGLSSIAFPLIGAGRNAYPAIEVVKAILDACSLFRQKDSPLKKVVIVVWSGDTKNQKIVEDSSATLKSYKPMGNGYAEIIPDVSDFSDPERAFRQSIGKDRRIRIMKVQVLPIEKGVCYSRYIQGLARVKARRPGMSEDQLQSYGWHGTRGDHANNIMKNGFDMSKIKRSLYGKGAYFASSADIAHTFSILGAYTPNGATQTLGAPQGIFTMLLCKLVTGKSQLGTRHMEKPDDDHDSARNGNGTYMVIFDGDCILPIAIIEYTVDRK